MILRSLVLSFFLILCFIVSSQSLEWNSGQDGGTILFEDVEIVFLVVKFEKKVEINRATRIYNKNIEKFQKELEHTLAKSGLNYTLISNRDLLDSVYSNTSIYPVIIDHGLQEIYSFHTGTDQSLLHIIVVDRNSNNRVRIKNIAQWGTKYVGVFKRFLRNVRKGKSMKFTLEKSPPSSPGIFAPSNESIELD